MRGKHIVYKGIRKDIPNLEPGEFLFERDFQDGKILRKLKNGNLLVATANGIKELEPKQIILTDKSASFFNELDDHYWKDGGNFFIGEVDENIVTWDFYYTLDPSYAAFAFDG